MLNNFKQFSIFLSATVLLLAVSCKSKIDTLDNSNTDLTIADNIISAGYENIIIPHRVLNINTIDMVLEMGFSAWELDLYIVNSDSNYFIVKHDLSDTSVLYFDDYLNYISDYEIDKLWLDVKNINPENISVAVDRLDYLDSKYDLKKVLIVESSTLDSSLSLVSEHGYHSSYYLSYKIINKLIADENITEMESYSLKISEQIVLQKVKAVSFDVSCYTFVTNYLIPKIDSNIVFHTWDLSLSLVDSNLINNIENKNYIDCKRIKTVLVKKE